MTDVHISYQSAESQNIQKQKESTKAVPSSFLFLLASLLLLVRRSDALVPSSFLFLLASLL